MQKLFKSTTLLATALGLALSAAAQAQAATDPALPANIVDALQKLGGPSEGLRKAHANGVCFAGTFTADPASAAAVTKAAAYNAKATYPVAGRFSIAGPNPHAPENTHDGRGLAVRLSPNADSSMDLVLGSTPMFLAATPEDFLDLLTTVAPDVTGKQNLARIDTYMKTHAAPGHQHQWLEAHPVFASYVTTPWYGIHAFRFVNAAGKVTMGKIVAMPAGGTVGLSDAEAKAKGPTFLAAELADRLTKGPAKIEVALQLAEPGDSLTDPSKDWPESRKTVHLGTLAVESTGGTDCVKELFMPTSLSEGVEMGDDVVLPVRAAAYGVSFGRRMSGK